MEIFCLYPGCPEFIHKKHIINIIEKEPDLLIKYDRFEMNLRLTRNPKIRWCPKPGCETNVVRQNTNQRELICHNCDTHFCAECSELWHGNLTCQQAQTRRIKLCPLCHAGVVKRMPSNRMQCHCGYTFCFICGKQYTQNHYKPWNLKGCPGGEYRYIESPNNGRMRRKFLAMVLSIVCSPCLFGGCLCSKVCQDNQFLDLTESKIDSCIQ